jgi:hypothetical protein
VSADCLHKFQIPLIVHGGATLHVCLGCGKRTLVTATFPAAGEGGDKS